MNILAIETSCDETSAAVVKDGREVLSNIVASQADIHAEFGGVVPEVAARNHIESIIPVVESARKKADLSWDDINSLAVVKGAGLLPSLLTGVVTAKSLAATLSKPLIPVNHIIGHIYANWIGKEKDEIKFPALALVISGGHTDLHIMSDHLSFRRLGGTLDDAAGEAFDKVAKLLGLGYPGGPVISEKAKLGKADAFPFPRGLMSESNYNFSFSGLKTAVIYKVRELEKKDKLSEQTINDLCASFQQAVVDVLVAKTLRAVEQNNVKSVLIAGGVAANESLRKTLKSELASKFEGVSYYQPEFEYCLDNAAMIGVAAKYIFDQEKETDFDWQHLEADPGLKIRSTI